MHQISAAGLALIKQFEGCRLTAYRDQGGFWTIGYGHTASVKPDQRITQAEADELLRGDLDWAEAAVNRAVTRAITQHQFDALVSFTYNLGAGSLRHSRVLAETNAGNVAAAAADFLQWDMAGGSVSPGLRRRREAERTLYLTPMPPAGLVIPGLTAPGQGVLAWLAARWRRWRAPDDAA